MDIGNQAHECSDPIAPLVLSREDTSHHLDLRAVSGDCCWHRLRGLPAEPQRLRRRSRRSFSLFVDHCPRCRCLQYERSGHAVLTVLGLLTGLYVAVSVVASRP